MKYFSNLNSSIYANDNCLSLVSNHVPNIMELLNTEVEHVYGWFKASYLTLNPSKNTYVIFHRDKKLVHSLRSGITVGGQEVAGVMGVRFLGVLLDECLKFGSHLISVACKVSTYTSVA